MQCYKCKVGLPNDSQFCLACGEAQSAPKPVDRSKQAGRTLQIVGGVVLVVVGIPVIASITIAVLSISRSPRDPNSTSASRIIPMDQVVVQWSDWIKDGHSISWKLPAGHYRLEMTANSDGATAEWIGGSCPKTQPMERLATTCEMAQDGQLIITNPTTFGLGASVSTTVKVTKLAW